MIISRLEVWLKWENACLVSARPWVPRKKKKMERKKKEGRREGGRGKLHEYKMQPQE
jgi:hypothetical protein